MKTIALTIAILSLAAIFVHALPIAERIILSKNTETTPISLTEQAEESCFMVKIEKSQKGNGIDDIGCFAAKALKDIATFLVKGLCTLADTGHNEEQRNRKVKIYDQDLKVSLRTFCSPAIR